MMFLSVEQLRKSVLIKVPELERHITELDGSISSYPNHLILVTGHFHLRTLEKPVRNRTNTYLSVDNHIRESALQLKQLTCHRSHSIRIGGAELQFTVGPFGKVRQ